VVWVWEWTILTERPPLVVEVSADFCGYRVPRGQRDGSLRPYSRFSRQEPLLFFQVAPQLYPRGWVDPVPDPLFIRILVASGIEPGPLDLKPGVMTTRPQRRTLRSTFVSNYYSTIPTAIHHCIIWATARFLKYKIKMYIHILIVCILLCGVIFDYLPANTTNSSNINQSEMVIYNYFT
jgi:hypothetical protein